MKKVLITVFFSFFWANLSCEKVGVMKNQDDGQPSLTISPTPTNQNGRPSAEFLKHYGQGLTLTRQGEFLGDKSAAIEEFKKAAEIDPQDTSAYWQIIELHHRFKKYDEEIIYLRRVMERDPQDTRAQWAIAHLLVWEMGRYEEGLKEAQIAKEKKASYFFVIEETMGRAYEGLGDIPNAIKHYKAYLKDFRDRKDTDSNLYKDMQKKVAELEKNFQNSNSNK